jgi:hypothetical protein
VQVDKDFSLSRARIYERAVQRATADPTLSQAQRPYAIAYGAVGELLSFECFRAYATANLDNFELAGSALRLITRLLCIRRVRGELHDDMDGTQQPICGEVPAPLIRTVMLKWTATQKREYDAHTASLYTMLYPVGSADADGGSGGRRAQDVHRVLCHMTQSLVGLYMSGIRAGGNLTTSTDPVQAARIINKTIHKALAGRAGQMLAIPRDRLTTADTLVNMSPKHAALMTVVNNVVVQRKEKLIVFDSWPVSQFLTEELLGLLGVRYKSMRADHNARTRETLVDEFNRADDEDGVFVISLR